VSTKDQEREGFSIPAQKRLLREYAQQQGISIVEEFVDTETAKKAGRTNFEAMLEHLRRHPSTRIILVEKTDRLYRNLRDYVTLDEMEVVVHLVKENVVLSKDSHSHARFMHGIRVLMARNYIDNLSEETRKGMREKAEEGHWPSSAPLGYLNHREGKAKSFLVIDPEKAPLVRQLFELYDTGEHSLRSLARKTQELGLRGKRGGRIQAQNLQAILRNPIYMGEFYWKGVRYDSKDPTLVSRGLWSRVNERLDGFPYTRATAHDFAYTGLIRCGHCNNAITAELKKGKYVYYHCAARCTKEPWVREEKLGDMLGELVRPLQLPAPVAEAMVATLKVSRQDLRRETSERITAARARIDRVGRLMDAAYEDKLDGRIDEAFFQRKRNEWEDQRAAAQRELDRLTQADDSSLNLGLQVIELAKRAYDLYIEQAPQERAKLLEVLLSNCTMAEGTLTPIYREPFDILVELAREGRSGNGDNGAGGAGCQVRRPLQDSNLLPFD